MAVRRRRLSRTRETHSWADRHTWAYRPAIPLVLYREQIEVALPDVVNNILQRLRNVNAQSSYNALKNWELVQLTMEVEIRKTPNDSWAEPRTIPGPILKRGGMTFSEFIRRSLTDARPPDPPLLTSLGVSFFAVRIKEIAVHHYRRIR